MVALLLKLLLLFQLLVAVGVSTWLSEMAGWPQLASIAGGLLCALAINASLITLEFLLAARYTRPLPADLRGRPSMVRAWLGELREAFMAFSVRQPFLGKRPLPSAAAPGREGLLPVLFVHGYFCNRALWRPLARTLAQRGHVTGSVNLEPVYGSIDDYADLIEAGVLALCERTGHDQVALVCHSMGGLAARAYLRAHGDLAIAKVITLGTPHRGTVMATLAHGRNARQMRLDSPWLAELAASETPARRRIFTVVFSHHDNIIAPQAIQLLPDADVIETAGIGHVALAVDAGVQQRVAELLVDRLRMPHAA